MPHLSKILVLGGTGLIGSALVRVGKVNFYPSKILYPTRDELDIFNYKDLLVYLKDIKPNAVILAAGKVGGIKFNVNNPFELSIQNQLIQTNVVRAVCEANINKVVLFGSSCMYPKACKQPMIESSILTGALEQTSRSYAVAKLAAMEMATSYNRQSSSQRFLSLIPCSVYGPNDIFDAESGHVLAALISRFHEAKLRSKENILLWGSGAPRREFIFSSDLARITYEFLSMDWDSFNNAGEYFLEPVNVGCGIDYSISELAQIISKVVGYTGNILWDNTQPDGALRKLLDNRKISALGLSANTSITAGVEKTYSWYKSKLGS